MGLFEDMSKEVRTFLSQPWTTEDARIIPDPEDFRLANHAKKLDAVVLYADLADSTMLVDTYEPQVVTRLYKAFLHCAAVLVRNNDGQIVAYDGDRIMAIYIGDGKNSNAVATALQLNYAVSEIINKKSNVQIKHVVGIDRSDIFASRIGVRDDNDIVWVGRAANYAAKLCSLTDRYQTYITDTVYKGMSPDLKSHHSWWYLRSGWKPYKDGRPINIMFSDSFIELT